MGREKLKALKLIKQVREAELFIACYGLFRVTLLNPFSIYEGSLSLLVRLVEISYGVSDLWRFSLVFLGKAPVLLVVVSRLETFTGVVRPVGVYRWARLLWMIIGTFWLPSSFSSILCYWSVSYAICCYTELFIPSFDFLLAARPAVLSMSSS